MKLNLFFECKEKRIEFYKSNIVVKRAIERDLEIIEEATNRIVNRSPEILIEESKSILV